MNKCEVCSVEIPELHRNGQKRRFCTEHTLAAQNMIRVNETESTAVGITAVTKLRHAALWALAKELGGQKALAARLGISVSMINEFTGMKNYPRVFEGEKKRWSAEKEKHFRDTLLVLTGQSVEELWPEVMRERSWLNAKKTVEQTREMESSALLGYVRSRETQSETEHRLEVQEAIDKALSTLTWRHREVIKRRFGIGYEPHSLRETGEKLKVTPERVRQMELASIRKLQDKHSVVLGEATGFIESEE